MTHEGHKIGPNFLYQATRLGHQRREPNDPSRSLLPA